MKLNDLFNSLSKEIQKGMILFMMNHDKIGDYVHIYDGVVVGSKGAGIIKSAGSPTANAILITHSSPYFDLPTVTLPDGTRILGYHQEEPSNKGATARNNALKKNIELQHLVGIWDRQRTKVNGKTKYAIGIGLPIAYVDEYFILALPNTDGDINDDVFKMTDRELFNLLLQGKVESEFTNKEDSESERMETFDPNSLFDQRKWVIRKMVQRQGSPKFRKQLIEAYDSKCAITGCDILEALQACHIANYCGVESNVVQNGLLLRADLHNLLDYGLLYIDPDTLTVVLHPKLRIGFYTDLHGKILNLPSDVAKHPSKTALENHKNFCGFE